LQLFLVHIPAPLTGALETYRQRHLCLHLLSVLREMFADAVNYLTFWAVPAEADYRFRRSNQLRQSAAPFKDSKIQTFKDGRQGRNSTQLRWIPDSIWLCGTFYHSKRSSISAAFSSFMYSEISFRMLFKVPIFTGS